VPVSVVSDELQRTASSYENKPVKIMDSVVAVNAGNELSMAIKEDGSLWVWGSNVIGRIGDGTATEYEPVFKEVPESDAIWIIGTRIKTFNDRAAPVKIMDSVVSMASGFNNTMAVKSDGTLWVWGDNYISRFAGDWNESFHMKPVQVMDSVVSVSAGGSHIVVTKDDGTLWAWGHGSFGNGNAWESSQVSLTAFHSDVKQMAVSERHVLMLKNDGTVWGWGENGHGELGNGTNINEFAPVQAQNLTDVKEIAVGRHFSVALKTDGTVWTWGWNEHGQLGDGTAIQRNAPVQVQGLSDVTAVSAGNRHTVALKSDGTVWAWGSSSSGELGDGTVWTWGQASYKASPVQVIGLSDVIAVSAGLHHTFALKSNGTVWAWGNNRRYTMGLGTQHQWPAW
jgi:alpha-tubulin suppressor-like RCC1 family protein